MTRTAFVSALALAAFAIPLSATADSGQVLISEIMYNPASYEGGINPGDPKNQTEWIELYNPTEQAVSLSGWYLQDEDGKTQPLPDSASIGPGEAIVLIPGTQTVADFQEAWGKGFQIFPLKGWAEGEDSLSNLSNSPSSTNEILTVRDADGELIDEVNYDDEGYWPSDRPHGPSIMLKPNALTNVKNDSGENWARSEPGKHGAKNAKKTEDYSNKDVGSPGIVAK